MQLTLFHRTGMDWSIARPCLEFRHYYYCDCDGCRTSRHRCRLRSQNYPSLFRYLKLKFEYFNDWALSVRLTRIHNPNSDWWPLSTDKFWIGVNFSLTSFGSSNHFSLTSFGLVSIFRWLVLDRVTTFHWRLLREISDKMRHLRVKSSSDELKSVFFVILEPQSMIYVKIVWADTIPLSCLFFKSSL